MDLQVVEHDAFADAAVHALVAALSLTESPCLGVPTGRTMAPVYQ